MSSFTQSRITVALAAVAATVALSGLLPSGDATARPVRPSDSLEQLRTQNAQLRTDLAAYQGAYDELSDGLDRVDRLSKSIRDRKTQRKLQRLVDDARDGAAHYLHDYEDDGYGGGYGGGHDTGYQAIGDVEFQKMVKRVTAASFADDQLEVVTAAAKVNYFTVDQVVALMKACTFEDTKIDVAAHLFSRIVDPNNWYLVYDGFTFSSSKKTLRERIGQ